MREIDYIPRTLVEKGLMIGLALAALFGSATVAYAEYYLFSHAIENLDSPQSIFKLLLFSVGIPIVIILLFFALAVFADFHTWWKREK